MIEHITIMSKEAITAVPNGIYSWTGEDIE